MPLNRDPCASGERDRKIFLSEITYAAAFTFRQFTLWLFARPALDQTLDYLFIDEAGQVSLANIVGMGISAKNVILVGDQMQLAQPIQGTHPGSSGMSALEYLLGDAATVPEDRGIFLSITRRMHPQICQFISDAVYDGRLKAGPDNARQHIVESGNIDPQAIASAGLLFVDVQHEGCPHGERVSCSLKFYGTYQPYLLLHGGLPPKADNFLEIWL